MTLAIRHLDTPGEARLAAELQRLIWGSDEVPAHVLLTAAHNGGLCAGAFVDGALAGFVWGFLGLDDRVDPPRLKHCSHQLGVHPAYRNQGLGFLLKRFQWEFVREQGIELITWTYDPLLATNAHLNVARLGAVCSSYRRDEYGELDDDLNAGLATDRFQVDLWVSSARVSAAMQGTPKDDDPLGDVYWLDQPGRDEVLLPPSGAGLSASLQAKHPRVAVAIPLDFQALRAANLQVAVAWRSATREAFEALFACGYTVVDFVRRPTFGCYILESSFKP